VGTRQTVSRQLSPFFFLLPTNVPLEYGKRNGETKFFFLFPFLIFVGKQKKSTLKKMEGHKNERPFLNISTNTSGQITVGY
jgi:hypothetical protein